MKNDQVDKALKLIEGRLSTINKSLESENYILVSLKEVTTIILLEAELTALRNKLIIIHSSQHGSLKTAELFGLSPARISQIRKSKINFIKETKE